MSTTFETCMLTDLLKALSEEQMTALARTFDTVSEPIWVEDHSGQCVYRNPRALDATGAEACLTFDIVDHADRLVGRLKARSAR